MHYNIHPFLLPPTLILITITLFLIYYLPITLQTTISNHKTHIINELSNDLFDETFILSQLNQFANDKISQEKTSVIQKQIYNKLLYIFLLTSIVLFLLSKKTFYNLHHINQTVFTTIFILITLYLFLRFILQETIFTDPNVIKYTILQIAIEKFKNKDVNIQDLFSNEINQIKDKLQNLSNNMTIPKNIMIPPTEKKLITVANSTTNLIIPPTAQKLI
jgi:hypothetical protein